MIALRYEIALAANARCPTAGCLTQFLPTSGINRIMYHVLHRQQSSVLLTGTWATRSSLVPDELLQLNKRHFLDQKFGTYCNLNKNKATICIRLMSSNG